MEASHTNHHSGCHSRVRQALQKWLGSPGFPNRSNVKATQSTAALSQMLGRPRQGFPEFWGRARAPRGDARAAIPCVTNDTFMAKQCGYKVMLS